MYFDGLIQELGDAPRYLLTHFGEVSKDAYEKSERFFLGRDNWICAEHKMFSVALPAYRDASRLSHWISSQHWNFLKNMVPRRFALARAEGISPAHFNKQCIDHIGEKIHIPLQGCTTIGHAEIDTMKLDLFRAYRFNDRFPATISVVGDTPALHLVIMFAPTSVVYFNSTARFSEIKERTDAELIMPKNINYVPV